MLRHWSSATGLLVLIPLVHFASPGKGHNIPNCTDMQLNSASASFACVTAGIGIPFLGGRDDDGQCPEGCCCDVQATSTGTVRRFVRTDTCGIKLVLDSSNTILESFVKPYTVDPSVHAPVSGLCQRKVPGRCKELMKNEQCAFDINKLLPAKAAAENDRRLREKSEKEMNSSSTSNSTKAPGNENDEGKKRNRMPLSSRIALSACLSFLACGLISVVALFIVRPILKSRQDVEEDASETDIAEALPGRVRSGRPLEIDEELMNLDAMRTPDYTDLVASDATIRTAEPSAHGEQDPFEDDAELQEGTDDAD